MLNHLPIGAINMRYFNSADEFICIWLISVSFWLKRNSNLNLMTRINYLHISCSCRSIDDSPINRMLFWFNEKRRKKDMQKIQHRNSKIKNGERRLFFNVLLIIIVDVVETFEFLLAFSKHNGSSTGTFFSKLHFAMHSMYAVCAVHHRASISMLKMQTKTKPLWPIKL